MKNDLLSTTVSTTLHIPATIDEVVSGLNGLGALLTAGKWARAAIVAAYVSPQQGRKPTSLTFEGSGISIEQFAALGIHGLKSTNSVAKYLAAWESTGLPKPSIGGSVVLPSVEFPSPKAVGAPKVPQVVLPATVEEAAARLATLDEQLAAGRLQFEFLATLKALAETGDHLILTDLQGEYWAMYTAAIKAKNLTAANYLFEKLVEEGVFQGLDSLLDN